MLHHSKRGSAISDCLVIDCIPVVSKWHIAVLTLLTWKVLNSCVCASVSICLSGNHCPNLLSKLMSAILFATVIVPNMSVISFSSLHLSFFSFFSLLSFLAWEYSLDQCISSVVAKVFTFLAPYKTTASIDMGVLTTDRYHRTYALPSLCVPDSWST